MGGRVGTLDLALVLSVRLSERSLSLLWARQFGDPGDPEEHASEIVINMIMLIASFEGAGWRQVVQFVQVLQSDLVGGWVSEWVGE